MSHFDCREHAQQALSNFSEKTAQTIKDYVDRGVPMGHFLNAVFANDLFGAFGRADEFNKLFLEHYVRFIYNYCPMGCHGSYEKVQGWVNRFQNKEEK